MVTLLLTSDDHAAAVTKETLIDRQADLGPADLAGTGLSAQLPGEFADLRDGLRGNRFAEGAETAAGVDGHPSPDRRRTRTKQLLGFALLAQTDLFVPVELERGRQVVDLGQAQVAGTDAGFVIRALGHRFFERELG